MWNGAAPILKRKPMASSTMPARVIGLSSRDEWVLR